MSGLDGVAGAFFYVRMRVVPIATAFTNTIIGRVQLDSDYGIFELGH
jgi:hypothetical protein